MAAIAVNSTGIDINNDNGDIVIINELDVILQTYYGSGSDDDGRKKNDYDASSRCYEQQQRNNRYYETKSGWCLREGLQKICTVAVNDDDDLKQNHDHNRRNKRDNGSKNRMLNLIRTHGPPTIYDTAVKIRRSSYCRHLHDNRVNGRIAIATEERIRRRIGTNDTKISDEDNHDEILTSNHDDGIVDENKSTIYDEPTTCFQSLCRIVAGQQLCGLAAKAIWLRLLKTVDNDLSPRSILKLISTPEQEQPSSSTRDNNIADRITDIVKKNLKEPAGLSMSKAETIVRLAKAFDSGVLSDKLLLSSSSSSSPSSSNDPPSVNFEEDDKKIRETLLSIKGIGPWTCDMFMMFFLHRSNILPLHDLGVRKGLARYFGDQLKHGKGAKGSLCPVKDAALIKRVLEPYQPYHSLVTYYMWKVADTKDVYNSSSNSTTSDEQKTTTTKKRSYEVIKQIEEDGAAAVSSKQAPFTPQSRRRSTRNQTSIRRQVTP